MVAIYDRDDTTTAQEAQSAVKFQRGFELPGGEYQYKFRVGDGDNWITDEKVPTSELPHRPPPIAEVSGGTWS